MFNEKVIFRFLSVRFQVFLLLKIKQAVDNLAVPDEQANEANQIVLPRILPFPPVGFKAGNRNSSV